MHLAFMSIGKLAEVYATLNNSIVLPVTNDEETLEKITIKVDEKEIKNVSYYYFKGDKSPSRPKIAMRFEDYLKLALEEGAEYIEYADNKFRDYWPIGKLIELASKAKNEDFRETVFRKYPRLKEELDSYFERYLISDQYWKKVPLKDLLASFLGLKPTKDSRRFEFCVGKSKYFVDSAKNKIFLENGNDELNYSSIGKIVLHPEFLKLCPDPTRYIAEKYNIWLEDYLIFNLRSFK